MCTDKEVSFITGKVLSEEAITERVLDIYSMLNKNSLFPPKLNELVGIIHNEVSETVRIYFGENASIYRTRKNKSVDYLESLDIIIKHELDWNQLPYCIDNKIIYPSPKLFKKDSYFKLIEKLEEDF